jgi:hypothetical protein
VWVSLPLVGFHPCLLGWDIIFLLCSPFVLSTCSVPSTEALGIVSFFLGFLTIVALSVGVCAVRISWYWLLGYLISVMCQLLLVLFPLLLS